MKLICGLGNPDNHYQSTRHNIGFRIVDAFSAVHRVSCTKKAFQGVIGEFSLKGEKTILLKPMTYMNLSGVSLSQACRTYKMPLEDILVVHDDVDLDLGQIRIKVAGGDGGHNGIKSITEELGSDKFCRLRIGVGRDKTRKGLIDYVLSSFDSREAQDVEYVIKNAAEAIFCWATQGHLVAMNAYNRKVFVFQENKRGDIGEKES